MDGVSPEGYTGSVVDSISKRGSSLGIRSLVVEAKGEGNRHDRHIREGGRM